MNENQHARQPDEHRYIGEVVWLPTYLGFAYLLLGATKSSGWFLFPALLLTRIVLEVIYRLTFGERRHEWSCKAIAFLLQLVVWGSFWAALYFNQRAA